MDVTKLPGSKPLSEDLQKLIDEASRAEVEWRPTRGRGVSQCVPLSTHHNIVSVFKEDYEQVIRQHFGLSHTISKAKNPTRLEAEGDPIAIKSGKTAVLFPLSSPAAGRAYVKDAAGEQSTLRWDVPIILEGEVRFGAQDGQIKFFLLNFDGT